MADINVLDLTPTTPGSNDSLILFDRTTGEGKSTRFDTLSSQVLDSKFGDSNPTAGQELSYDATTGKYKNTSRINSLNEALSNEVEARAALGAHNLFDIETWLNSVNLTYTVNNDVYSTSTGGTSYGTPYIFADKDIDIVISGIITNDTSDNVRFEVLNSSNAVVATIKENTTYASGKGCKVRLNWSTSGDFTIEKPMIRLASDPSSEYTPYAMTNRELTNARFLNGTLGPVVADNFTDKAEYTIPNDGWYYLYLQTNVAASGSTLRIMLGSDYSANSVAHHKNSNIQYESAYANLPLKKGTKVVFKCTDASVSCQYNVTPIT